MTTAQHSPQIEEQPGYWIRRLQQIAVAMFLQETADYGITPVQYGALQAICNQPGMDQRRLAALLSLDTSTLGSVLDRMESHGWCERHASPHDKRVRLLNATAEGHALLKAVVPHMQAAQSRILAPLSERQQAQFMKLLTVLVTENSIHSRAPGVLTEPSTLTQSKA